MNNDTKEEPSSSFSGESSQDKGIFEEESNATQGEHSDGSESSTGQDSGVIDPRELQAEFGKTNLSGNLSENPAIIYWDSTVQIQLNEVTIFGGETGDLHASIGLVVPGGYQIALPSVLISAYLESNEPVPFRRSYRFEGSNTTADFEHELRANQVDESTSIWSPCQDNMQPQHVNLLLDYELRVPASQSTSNSASLMNISFATSYLMGAKWRHCDGLEVVKTPGKKGEKCGGSNNFPCASNLACELIDDPARNVVGTCVDPSDSLGAETNFCGGPRDRFCKTDIGLTCWYPTQKHIDEDWLGECTPSLAKEYRRCESGIPAIACESPLGCFPMRTGKHCRRVDGTLGSYCDNTIACQEPLMCDVDTCRLFVGLDQACGDVNSDGIVDAECQRWLRCRKASADEVKGICEPSPCKFNVDCNSVQAPAHCKIEAGEDKGICELNP